MDPLSIAASVIALCSAGKFVYEIASSLYISSGEVKGAGDDIEIFAEGVGNFGVAMGTAYCALEPICISTNTPSRVVGYLIQNGGLESLVGQSKRLTKYVKRYESDIYALRGRSKFIARLKWAFQRKEINALGLRMESVKSNLQIIISSIAIEALMEQPRTTANEEHIKFLNLQIRVHVRTIGRLLDQIEKHPHPTLGTDRSRGLVDLGLSMAHNGTVPSSLPSPASSSRSIMSLHPSTRLHYSNISISTSQSRPVLNPTRENPHLQQPRSQSMETTQVHQPLDPSENRLRPTGIEVDTTAPQNSLSAQGDFISVYEDSCLLSLNPSNQVLAEPGYITSRTGPVSTAALIDPGFGANLISQSYAIRLGLEIEDLEASEEEIDVPWIDFGDGQRQRPVSRLKLDWNDGLQPSRVSFPVHCWVVEHNLRNVVFGKPFIRKRNHYRNRGSN